MKKLVLISACILLFFSCKQNSTDIKTGSQSLSSSSNHDSLISVNNQLLKTIGAKDSTIKSILAAFSSIQLNLYEIGKKQAEIKSSKKGEGKKKLKKRILKQIKSIEDLNRQNKETVLNLKESLKESNSSSPFNYDYFLQNLDVVIFKNDSQITEMINLLEKNNYKVELWEQKYFEAKKEADEKNQKLNTAYYTSGTKKELLQKGVITKQGGFIGLGKSQKLSEHFNNENFQEVNITKLKQIKFKVEKVKLVTTHPANSYTIIKSNDDCTLTVLNADKFWSASKYMVVLIEKE